LCQRASALAAGASSEGRVGTCSWCVPRRAPRRRGRNEGSLGAVSADVMCKTKAMENMEATAMNKSISSGIVGPEEHEGEVADGPNVVAHGTRASA
jgi:hypothetical protein